MICSSEPPGMIRASTTSASRIGTPALSRRDRKGGSCLARAGSRADPPMCATSPSYWSTTPTWPRSPSARHNSSVCQPVRALRMTALMTTQHSRIETQKGETESCKQRRAQNGGVQLSSVEGASARRAREPHFCRTEQHRIDLIEVVVVAFEDVVERRAVI